MLAEVNLNLYKYFLAVIEEKSVSKAAEKLRVSQPSVSYNIHELQRALREKLFSVERCGLVPLPRALVLYERLKPVFSTLFQSIQEFEQSADN
ncbi:MAG: LysR family transcriptional regulator [Clostridia bacterium]|nr:LysR family transcriptional regulator [Clostridia bacterium]